MKYALFSLLFFSTEIYCQPYTPITNPKIQVQLDSAVFYLDHNQLDKGFTFFDKAVLVDTTNLTILQLKSSWESVFQLFEKALQTTFKEIQLRPDVAYFHLDAGLFLRRLGDTTKSILYLQNAIKLFDKEIKDSINRDSSRQVFLRAVAMLFSDQEYQGKKILKAIYEETKSYNHCPLWGHLDESTDILIVRWLDPKYWRE